MSEVLAKVVRTQAEVVDLAEKRAEVLSCIEEFEAVRAECRWLNEYEHDEMRYKVNAGSPVCGCGASSLYLSWPGWMRQTPHRNTASSSRKP